jgi:hypothetical protein
VNRVPYLLAAIPHEILFHNPVISPLPAPVFSAQLNACLTAHVRKDAAAAACTLQALRSRLSPELTEVRGKGRSLLWICLFGAFLSDFVFLLVFGVNNMRFTLSCVGYFVTGHFMAHRVSAAHVQQNLLL